MDSKDIVFDDDDTFGSGEDSSDNFLSDDSESSVLDEEGSVSGESDDHDYSESETSSNQSVSKDEGKKPFFKTQNGILAIAGVIGFIGYAGYTFMDSSATDGGNIGSMSTMQEPVQNSMPVQNAAPLQQQVASNNIVNQAAIPVNNNDVNLANMTSPSGELNSGNVMDKNPCSLNPVNKSDTSKVKTASFGDNTGINNDLKKETSNEDVSKLKEKVKELSLKIDSLTASLMASYEIIDGNLKAINEVSSASSEKMDKVSALIEENKKSEVKHYKSLTWRLRHLSKSNTKGTSKKTSSSSKVSKVISGSKIKNLKLTSVVNGTGWIKDSMGRNSRLSVGDKFKGKIKVSKILPDRIVLSNGNYISK